MRGARSRQPTASAPSASARSSLRGALRALASAALALGVGAAPAAAQVQPPSLTSGIFGGIVQYDFRAGVARDEGVRAAVDAARGRHYVVGSTESGGASAVALVAWRPNGVVDPGFAGDGSLELALGRDAHGVDVAVLPDGRLRVLARTDVAPSGAADYDTAVVGLLPDGSPDPDFPTVTFPAGAGADDPRTIAVAADGRIAVAGGTGSDAFVAVNGIVTTIDAAASAVDAAVDVVWAASGPVLLLETPGGASVRAVGGFDTPVTVPGATSVTPGGLVAHGGHYWVAGTAVVSGDADAFLARVDGSGGSLETRRFDMRGSEYAAAPQVTGAGLDLALVPGDPDTLVVSGSSAVDRGPQWAFAAFNGLDGALSGLAYTDLVLPFAGHRGEAAGVAASAGAVVAAGALEEPGTTDVSLATARILIDDEKRCDLALAVVSPVELLLRGLAGADVTVRVTNNGKRPCAGTLGLSAPWRLAAGDLSTGRLLPGQTLTRTLTVGYGAPLPQDATLELTLAAAADLALGDNVARVRAVFSYCDLALRVLEAPPVIGTEGSRRFAFTVRNVGTAPCRSAQVIARAPGVRGGAVVPYTVAPGKSVEDEISVGIVRGLKTGTRAGLTFQVVDSADVAGANDVASSTPVVVRPGDTNARTPVRGRSFSGRATRGAAVGVSARTLRVRRVELAVRRLGGGCRWLSSVRGDLRTVDEAADGKCNEPVWITVKGTERWSLKLRARLPKGRYELRSRAVLANGLAEGRFTRADKNLIRFRVR